MKWFNLQSVVELATPEEKESLLRLVVRRQNLKADIDELTLAFRADKKALEEPLAALDASVFDLLDQIQRGQPGLFQEPEVSDADETQPD
jgi:hypothetical protein